MKDDLYDAMSQNCIKQSDILAEVPNTGHLQASLIAAASTFALAAAVDRLAQVAKEQRR